VQRRGAVGAQRAVGPLAGGGRLLQQLLEARRVDGDAAQLRLRHNGVVLGKLDFLNGPEADPLVG
jgi:hypothetical protein